ncbi:MAG: Asp-tRNA(Asn)/Glu-tRNA(Gln) amidotransferase subunit GatA [Candidatus Diapherotrites archaeon]|nr:Asp-tRNA(Asn)/Glu-tRNA(Gln) amidotransferase subunit GatA [Candidatus Diapherotrites archaeon]
MKKTLPINEFVLRAKSGEISVEEHTQKILEEIKKSNPTYHYFNSVSEQLALAQAKELQKIVKEKKPGGKLFGVPVSVKDCICVKGVESTAGSKILEGYVPVFDATVVVRAIKEGAIIIGKTSQDEFGFGTFSTNTAPEKTPLNPFERERSCGGSSGGSAGYTAFSVFSHASIAESTGGSIACPASFCGAVGITPTYGRVSRYGLMDYASSLDKIGCISKTVQESALLLQCISGHDALDSTSLKNPVVDFSPDFLSAKNLRVGIVKEFFGAAVDKKVSDVVWGAVKKLESAGVKVEETSMPLNAKYGVSAYYLIAVSEASTNLARYCGMRYGLHGELEGNFDEYFSKVRSAGFSKEAKRRIILGTFARMSGFRDAFYLRAMKARTSLIKEFAGAFKKFDAIVHPAMPIVAPKFSKIKKLSPLQHYAMDLCTVPANLAGVRLNISRKGFQSEKKA